MMSADVLKVAMLKHIFRKVKDLLGNFGEVLIETRDVRYVSVPIWRPWRDF